MGSLGLRMEKEIAITGVKAYMDTGRPGPCLALLGEMDGLPLPAHKHANPRTQASHACGHHCQLTGVAGAYIDSKHTIYEEKGPEGGKRLI